MAVAGALWRVPAKAMEVYECWDEREHVLTTVDQSHATLCGVRCEFQSWQECSRGGGGSRLS